MEQTRKILNNTTVVVDDESAVIASLAASYDQSAVCVLFDGRLKALEERVVRELKRGCRVFEFEVPTLRSGKSFDGDIPEFVRHVLGIGAGSVAEQCKRQAKKLNVDWSLVLSAPSTDTILSGYSPKNVFICPNVLMKCPFECVAAGYGVLLSEPLRAFENFFARKVLAFEDREVKPCSEPKDVVDLAVKLMEISADKDWDDSASLMARLLFATVKKTGKRPRLIGEYKFLASSLIAAFYGAYLKAPSYDVMPPSSLDAALDVVAYLDVKDFIPVKKVDFFDINAYFRISYILSEYRLDLLEKLGGVDRHTWQRFWRRLYPDAGYWLKREVNMGDMLHSMALAGAFSDSLLGYAFASGVTARF